MNDAPATYTFTLGGLVRKRAELAGEIEAVQERLTELVRQLEALDATIRIFDADYQIEAIKPKARRPPDNWAKRGEMTRIILNILRQAAQPLTTRDIALQLMTERALDVGDASLVRLMVKRCGVALRGQRDSGAVRSAEGPGMQLVWSIHRHGP
mgnify:CR=1 FL=1